MKIPRRDALRGFSIMPLPIFLAYGIVVGWVIHHYSDSTLISVIGGVASIPITVWFLDLVFNNAFALKFQNYPGNHECPSCKQKYETYRSMPDGDNSVILGCFRCGAKHRIDNKYNHLQELGPNNETKKAEQVGAGDAEEDV